jgi:glutamate synthase domain-containing protein 1
VLINLLHRGASGCEANTGDGAGILIQIPDRFLRKVTAPLGIALPPSGQYGAGFVFFPRALDEREEIRRHIARVVEQEGQTLLGWRSVPTDDRMLGASAVAAEPVFEQLFIGDGSDSATRGPDAQGRFERKLYVIRKRIEHLVDGLPLAERHAFYIPSLSSRTLIYKGMLTAAQIETMFPDLVDPDVESALALVHQRFSPNTFPSWPLAHPYRQSHNSGEINSTRQHQLDAREEVTSGRSCSEAI